MLLTPLLGAYMGAGLATALRSILDQVQDREMAVPSFQRSKAHRIGYVLSVVFRLGLSMLTSVFLWPLELIFRLVVSWRRKLPTDAEICSAAISVMFATMVRSELIGDLSRKEAVLSATSQLLRLAWQRCEQSLSKGYMEAVFGDSRPPEAPFDGP